MGSMAIVKHALITGGASGMGLSLAKHLLQKPEWKVVIADIRPEQWDKVKSDLDADRTHFIQADVSNWDSQAALFKEAFAWSGGRIDFFAANAGIADKDSVLAPMDLDNEPKKPNLICVDVCEIAVFYGLQLFVYYTRKAKQRMSDPSSFKPKMVVTASCAGLYDYPIAPQYNAAKHAVVALSRASGPSLLAADGIAVNCICPAFVMTGIMPEAISDLWPKEYITPHSTIVRAFMELIDETGTVEQDGLSDGENGVVKTGCAVEAVVDKLYYRKPVDFADESQRFLIEDAHKPDGYWARGARAAIEKGQIQGSEWRYKPKGAS
jgi:15-hydroxyprostaglandin dehydrogenase (NAD)